MIETRERGSEQTFFQEKTQPETDMKDAQHRPHQTHVSKTHNEI